jgi:DNA-binding transcriptional regulator YdaS (Cro superfamily)
VHILLTAEVQKTYTSVMDHAIDRVARVLGSQNEIAALVGVTKAAVAQWKLPGRRVPAEHCVVIERTTGGVVSRRELRPDDWWLIWPELVTDEHPVPTPAEQA